MGRALLIQDSASLRTSYSQYLVERGFDVYTAHGVADTLALLPAVKPDVTALDLDIHGDDGFELIQPIRKSGSFCMIVSGREANEDRIRALSLGADDYVVKPVNLEELFLRMRNMLERRRGLHADAKSTILDLHGVRVDLVSRAILDSEDRPGSELTATELTLLRILTDNIERVVSKETLFSAIRGDAHSPTTRALDVGMSRLRIKLRESGAGVDIRSVRQAGYLLSRALGARESPQASHGGRSPVD